MILFGVEPEMHLKEVRDKNPHPYLNPGMSRHYSQSFLKPVLEEIYILIGNAFNQIHKYIASGNLIIPIAFSVYIPFPRIMSLIVVA